MGSAKVSSATLNTMGDAEKKGFNFLRKLKLGFGKKEKPKEPKAEKQKNSKEQKDKKDEPKIDPVDRVLGDLEKLKIDKEKREKEKQEEDEDESQFFSYKIVKDDSRTERIDSQSSEDSGFAEPKAEDEVTESIKNLKIEDGDKKKTKTVLIPRGPVRGNVADFRTSRDPYPVGQAQSQLRQISQINKHTLSGGQVLVNTSQVPDNYSEVDIALKSVEKISQKRQKEKEYLEDVLELIHNDTQPQDTDFLSDFVQIQGESCDPIHIVPTETPEPNPVEEFSSSLHVNYDDFGDMTNMLIMGALEEERQSKSYIFPTPPRSENVPSPMSESQASFYPSNSDYTLSPERSSPIYNSDYEKYQDLTGFDEFPNSIEADKPRERTSSISSMTMKQFKDLQKDIANGFSKMECCDTNRKSCKEIFQEHLSKLKMVERKNLCLKVAKLDLSTAYGVLQNILLSLSRGAEQEDLQYSLFALICERVLAQKPALFAHDFGLSLLKSAALRCPHRPLLTRYLVQCVRVALKVDSSLTAGKDSVFQEVDAQGDSLVIACARAGDAYSAVLSEIVRHHTHQPPLFRVHHANTDGYTALHVSCSQHSARAPRLHTVHVLLTHAQADVWKGDVKGGDTAVHLAVNSANCDLQLIMMLFKSVDRKLWKSLAHCRNMSSVTPLEYARSATKSTTRQNYPQEVLDFLKKCR